MPKIKDQLKCYDETVLEKVPTPTLSLSGFVLHRCKTCDRLFDQEGRLLVPFIAFKQKDTTDCNRCGGPTDYMPRQYRYRCKNSFCGFSWYQSQKGHMSPDEAELKEKQKRLFKEMTDNTDHDEDGTFIKKAKEYKDVNRRLQNFTKARY